MTLTPEAERKQALLASLAEEIITKNICPELADQATQLVSILRIS